MCIKKVEHVKQSSFSCSSWCAHTGNGCWKASCCLLSEQVSCLVTCSSQVAYTKEAKSSCCGCCFLSCDYKNDIGCDILSHIRHNHTFCKRGSNVLLSVLCENTFGFSGAGQTAKGKMDGISSYHTSAGRSSQMWSHFKRSQEMTVARFTFKAAHNILGRISMNAAIISHTRAACHDGHFPKDGSHFCKQGLGTNVSFPRLPGYNFIYFPDTSAFFGFVENASGCVSTQRLLCGSSGTWPFCELKGVRKQLSPCTHSLIWKAQEALWKHVIWICFPANGVQHVSQI